MIYSWETSTTEIKEYVFTILGQVKERLGENFKGFYLHGSLAMDGFNPESSDIDVIVVTDDPITLENKKELAQYLLSVSGNPYPIEVHVLNIWQLRRWQHPSSYDFHYSELCRDRLENNADNYLNEADLKDTDLAAHITILHRRGICLEGPPIEEIFPPISHSEYLSSIRADYEKCMAILEKNPLYSVMKIMRAYWYIKVGTITTKQEAGEWGINTLPKEVAETVKKVMEGHHPEKQELQQFKEYMETKLGD